LLGEKAIKVASENKERPLIISIKSMNDLSPLKPRLLAGIGLTLIAAAIYLVRVPIVSAGPPAGPEKPAESNALSGATLYAINCSRCHQERYPAEFTVANWRNIMIHMRVRANLPAGQAREILKYLEEDAGN
jgi:mono/diheme cytochrome c family protein